MFTFYSPHLSLYAFKWCWLIKLFALISSRGNVWCYISNIDEVCNVSNSRCVHMCYLSHFLYFCCVIMYIMYCVKINAVSCTCVIFSKHVLQSIKARTNKNESPPVAPVFKRKEKMKCNKHLLFFLFTR